MYSLGLKPRCNYSFEKFLCNHPNKQKVYSSQWHLFQVNNWISHKEQRIGKTSIPWTFPVFIGERSKQKVPKCFLQHLFHLQKHLKISIIIRIKERERERGIRNFQQKKQTHGFTATRPQPYLMNMYTLSTGTIWTESCPIIPKKAFPFS